MYKKIALYLSLLGFGIIAGVFLSPLISSDNLFDQLEKYKFVFNTAYKNYVDDVSANALTEAAIKGMLGSLDPHSQYINKEEIQSVNEDMQGSFEGIGVQFDIINDTITVISPIAGGPSEAVGILAGDKIVKIDGVSAIGLKQDDVPKKLRGPKGTKVELDIFRPGMEGTLKFTIIRDKIPLHSVSAAYMFYGTDIGVISVNRFSATTHEEIVNAANDLRKQGMKRLILDLRNNPGGLLNQAFLVADEFLPGEGDTIVYTRGRAFDANEVFRARKGQQLENIPLIVLIDNGSASASEIVSGAVQDLDRGLVVGITSFGKGLVQRQIPLPDGSAFRLTISRYYTPSGRCIQRPFEDKNKY
jgi:carboxyl-terminal processing protease